MVWSEYSGVDGVVRGGDVSCVRDGRRALHLDEALTGTRLENRLAVGADSTAALRHVRRLPLCTQHTTARLE